MGGARARADYAGSWAQGRGRSPQSGGARGGVGWWGDPMRPRLRLRLQPGLHDSPAPACLPRHRLRLRLQLASDLRAVRVDDTTGLPQGGDERRGSAGTRAAGARASERWARVAVRSSECVQRASGARAGMSHAGGGGGALAPPARVGRRVLGGEAAGTRAEGAQTGARCTCRLRHACAAARAALAQGCRRLHGAGVVCGWGAGGRRKQGKRGRGARRASAAYTPKKGHNERSAPLSLLRSDGRAVGSVHAKQKHTEVSAARARGAGASSKLGGAAHHRARRAVARVGCRPRAALRPSCEAGGLHDERQRRGYIAAEAVESLLGPKPKPTAITTAVSAFGERGCMDGSFREPTPDSVTSTVPRIESGSGLFTPMKGRVLGGPQLSVI